MSQLINERAEFEKWFTSDTLSLRALERNGENYKLMQANSAWIVWQARAALEPKAKPALKPMQQQALNLN
jgi:hypothetical protein